MSLRKHKQGAGTVIAFKRVQKRNFRRPLEAKPHEWQHWDAAAAVAGLNWSEFTRRALNAATAKLLGYQQVSEKPGSKLAALARANLAAKRAGRKG